MIRNFFSIDFGMSTGFTLFKNGKIQFTDSYSILSNESEIPILVVNRFFELVKNYEVQIYVVEDYSYSKRFFNTVQSEIVGAFKYKVSTDKKGDVFFVNSKTVKKVLLGNGNAKKGEVKRFLKGLGIECKNQHEYDSVLIGLGFLKMQELNDFSDAFKRRAYSNNLVDFC